MFTPFRCPGGPAKSSNMKKLRVTKGQVVSTGKQFKLVDGWTLRAKAHRLLPEAWIGVTSFEEIPECLDLLSEPDSSNEIDTTQKNDPGKKKIAD